jgi:hypothetical protein
MKVALLIPDGVGVRNFLVGTFLPELAQRSKVAVFHIVPDNMLDTFKGGLNGSVSWHPIIDFNQPLHVLTLQYTLGWAQMYWANTAGMRRNLGQPLSSNAKMRAFTIATRLAGRLAASPRRMNAVEKLHVAAASRVPEVEYYRRRFQEFRPSVVFCSHQRPSIVVPAVLAARSLNIPTATFIFSWDNITSKGRITAPFDHYLVWSQLMHDELVRYYPHVPKENIHVVGTPQFEPYGSANGLQSREAFLRSIGADPARPLICFSGGDVFSHPEDPEHLRILMQHIQAGRIKRNPQVLLRPGPVDDGTRYKPVLRDYPELIYKQPAWVFTREGDWSRVIPMPDDVNFLANLTHHADLNVNLNSTMTLDFAIHDRPVVNLAFDVAEKPPFGMPVWDYCYGFDHYQPVIQFGAARFARTADQLAEHVNAYLDDPTLDREGRRRFVDLEVGVPVGQSVPHMLTALEKIAAEPAPRKAVAAV